MIIPDELKHLPRISPSGLAKLIESPAHYKAYKDKKSEPTQAMIDGTIIHMACLEPSLFHEKYTCEITKDDCPDALFTVDDLKAELDRQGVSYKSTFKKPQLIDLVRVANPSAIVFDTLLTQSYAEKEPIKKSLWNACENLSRKIHSRPFESKIWANAVKEEFVWWLHPKGVIISMRPDLYAMDVPALYDGKEYKLNVVLDIKKVTSVNDKSLRYEMIDSQNPMKAALYADGLTQIHGKEFNQFCFLYVTDKEPYSIRNLALTTGHLEAGRMVYEAAIDTYLECLKNDYWPDNYEEVTNWVEPYNYFEFDVPGVVDNLNKLTNKINKKFNGVSR